MHLCLQSSDKSLLLLTSSRYLHIFQRQCSTRDIICPLQQYTLEAIPLFIHLRMRFAFSQHPDTLRSRSFYISGPFLKISIYTAVPTRDSCNWLFLVMIYTNSIEFQAIILIISQFFCFFEPLSCPPTFLKSILAVYL